MDRRIAFLGLGTMGAGMARNLLAAGCAVTGYNRTRARAESLASDGLTVADTPAEAADGAEVVIACVADDAALEAVLRDADAGAFGRLSEGALVMDCGTTSPATTARLAEETRARGGAYLDAPITGSKLGAEGGRLTFMVGGAKADVDRARPLMEVMGRHTVHVGEEVGMGQRAKLCLNLSQSIVLEGVLEGLVLGKRLGVAPERLLEIFEHSAGKTGVGSFKAPYLLDGDYTPHFRLDLMQKDLHLALSEASQQRVPLPAARAVTALYDAAAAEGMGPEDFLATAKLLMRWARVSLEEES
jgi:3-hydroxyisobutyrate dehydrogenase-like beta-hydroxyacid dehydrogenase